MKDARETARGILASMRVRDSRQLRSELAEAQRLEEVENMPDSGEQERRELLASLARSIQASWASGNAVIPRKGPAAIHLVLLRHLAGHSAVPHYLVRKATASISTWTSRGNRAASTVARAGTLSWK